MAPEPLLYVDDRPSTLTDVLLARRDIAPVLLRFSDHAAVLPPAHLARTAHLPRFVLDPQADPRVEAERCLAGLGPTIRAVRRFLNPSEPGLQAAHAFARALGLPALRPEQVRWLRDKAAMKARLAAIGLPVAPSRVVHDAEEVAEFAAEYGWPVVVKPVEGFACFDTHVVRGPAELGALRWTTTHPWIPARWLVEAFVPWLEFECCALLHGGRALDSYLSVFPAPPLAATDGAMNANISVREQPSWFPVDMRALIDRIAAGFELDHGYLHMELFCEPGGRYLVSEVALRLAGCEIPANHALGLGFDIFGALLDIHLGRRPALDYRRRRAVGDLLLPARPGRVTAISELDELLRLPGVIAGALRYAVGDVIPNRRASHVSAGFVHVEGDDATEVEARMQRVLDRFHLTTQHPTPAGAAREALPSP